MIEKPIIVWYRHDLRTRDHMPLYAATQTDKPIIAVFILDESAQRPYGGASRWWLYHSLNSLQSSLSSLGGELILRRGETLEVLKDIAKTAGADQIVCSRQYEPEAVALERQCHDFLGEAGITLKRYSGTLLFEPETVATQNGDPYKVFTPFWRRCQDLSSVRKPLPSPNTVNWYSGEKLKSEKLKSWELISKRPEWSAKLEPYWQPGEEGAHQRLQIFLKDRINHYKTGRDVPGESLTSQLSPHLSFGEISPGQIKYACENSKRDINQEDKACFLSELGWREFSHHLLFHFPTLPQKPFNSKFSKFPWKKNRKFLSAWQAGQTGIPLVDAGMRELWQTGWMHNRVRMIVGSLLVKNLLIHWHEGESWFWDTLVDANLGNNAASWQWIAGSGADAAPYFRIFNPVTQSKRFDSEGRYLRRWLPELKALPDKYIHAPWEAPQKVLDEAGVELGTHYPQPLVDLKTSRQQALDAFASIK